jgi:mono/diheme cytochrome c family protein
VIRAAWYAGAAVLAAAVSLLSGVARPDDGRGGATASGPELFRTKGCATCHDGPDGASLTDAGPSLVDAAAWAGERMPEVSASEYVEQSVRNPSAFISPAYVGATGGPGRGMPLLRLSDEEIDAIVRYLLEPRPLVSADGNE